MTTDLNAIKEKIRRRLAVAENDAAAEAEVETAMRVATHLMMAHRLNREDISKLSEAERSGRIEYGKYATYSWGKNFTYWESILASFVKEFVGTVGTYIQRVEYRRRGKKMFYYNAETPDEAVRLTFYGPDDDARFCVELFEEILIATATMAQMRWGGYARGAGGSYCQGFVSGLREANAKETKALQYAPDSQTRALVLRSQANSLAIRNDGKRWLEKTTGYKLCGGSRRQGVGRGYNAEAYSEGKADGRNYAVGGKQPKPKQIGG